MLIQGIFFNGVETGHGFCLCLQKQAKNPWKAVGLVLPGCFQTDHDERLTDMSARALLEEGGEQVDPPLAKVGGEYVFLAREFRRSDSIS